MNLMANLPMLACLLLGSALIILEVFLPGFGLPGISGVVLIGAGVVLVGMSYGAAAAVGVLLVLLAVLAVLISGLLRSAARGGSKIFLSDTQELHGKDMQVLVGKKGTASSALHPAGIADFDGVRLNVITEGDFIERGAGVEIVSAEGSKIIVRSVHV